MSQRSKPPKQLLKPSGTNSLSTMGCLKRSSRIKAITSRVGWWLTSVSWWEHRKCRLVHTFCRPMASVRDLTPLWSICLGCYPRRRSQEWKNHIGTLVHAYNCTWNRATRFSPYFLMFGETASSPYQCYPWSGCTDHHGAKYHKICAENKGMHPVGS